MARGEFEATVVADAHSRGSCTSSLPQVYYHIIKKHVYSMLFSISAGRLCGFLNRVEKVICAPCTYMHVMSDHQHLGQRQTDFSFIPLRYCLGFSLSYRVDMLWRTCRSAPHSLQWLILQLTVHRRHQVELLRWLLWERVSK